MVGPGGGRAPGESRVGMRGAARGVWAGVLGSLLLISPAEAEADPDGPPLAPAAPAAAAARLGGWGDGGDREHGQDSLEDGPERSGLDRKELAGTRLDRAGLD